MIKKDYMKPAIEVWEADAETQILAGTVASIKTIGFDTDDDLVVPGSGQSTTGNIWDDSW